MIKITKARLRWILLLIAGLQLCGTAFAQTILTLGKAMEISKANSPAIQRSLLNLTRSEESLKAQKAALKSKFALRLTPFDYSQRRTFDDFSSSWYTSKSTSSSGTFVISQPILPTDGTLSLNNSFGWQNQYSSSNDKEDKSFSNDLYLSYRQPLFTYNRTKLELEELQLDLENSNLSYAMQMLNLEKNVTQFFYNVYLSQMSLQIARDELANTQKSFDITKNKVDAGLAAKEELYQAELNLATAKSNLQNKEVTLQNSNDQFKQYIGMDIFEEITIMANVEVTPIKVDPKKAIDYGLNARMEIRQREIDIETSQFQLVRTSALNEFRGDVDLSIGIIGNNKEFVHTYDNPTNSPKVSVSFDIPLWDWGEKKARLKAQEAVIQTRELSLDEEKTQIIIDIRKVYRNLQNLVNQIQIAEQNVKNAQLTYEINLERYANGDLTSMDLNLFQNQLSEKKMAHANSLIDYKIELLNLKIQTLYDFQKDEAIVPEEIIKKSSK